MSAHPLVVSSAAVILGNCPAPHTSPVAAPDPLRSWALQDERCD